MKTILFALLLGTSGTAPVTSTSSALDQAVINAVVYALPDNVVNSENGKTEITVSGYITEQGKVNIRDIQSPDATIEQEMKTSLGDVQIIGGRFFKGRTFHITLLV